MVAPNTRAYLLLRRALGADRLRRRAVERLDATPGERVLDWSIAIWVVIFASMYYFYFTRQFLRGNIVMGGDTQVVWSLNYLALYSLANFGEFLWWDPTTINGWPAYVNLTSGMFNYLGPYTLPSLVLFLLGNSIVKIDINAFLVVQKTLYYFVLNLLAVILISRELIKGPLPRLLPTLIFTLSAIQFHGFRDSALIEVMPAPLFYVFSLIYYNNRRTPAALITLLVFLGLFIASLDYGGLQTSLWWTSAFTVFLVVFYPDLVGSAFRTTRELGAMRQGRLLLGLVLLFFVAALLAFLAPVYFNVGELVRVPGSGPVDYDVGVYGGFVSGNPGEPLSALSHPVWTNILYWSPFPVIHDFFLLFDDKGGGQKAGVDHRYIGLATLPLLLIALVRGYRSRYVWILFVTAFACSAFIVYTSRNLLISSLAELLPLFRNIRTIADTLPRDAPIIFLALAAGMGLDLLVGDAGEPGESRRVQRVLDRFGRGVLIGLLVLSAATLLASLVPVPPFSNIPIAHKFATYGGPQLPALKEALAHIGIYLFLFSLLCLLLLFVRVPAHKGPLTIVLLALAFFDLTVSASAYWGRGLVWFKNEGPHALPQLKRFAPVDSTLQTWPGSYGGFINNPFGGPFIGLRSWLPLATRPEWRSVLENWDAELRIMSKYPDFRFYSAGSYIPFDGIKTIDSVPNPPEGSVRLYVHDDTLAKDGTTERLEATWEVTAFTPNRVRVRVSMPKDGLMVFLDNFDRFWSAEVDGHAVPVRKANFTFKTIALAAGEHQVEWRYSPSPVKAFWILSYAALALLLLAILGWGLRPATLLVSVSVLAWIAFQYALGWYMADHGNVRPHAIPRLAREGGQAQLRLGDGKNHTVIKGAAGSVERVYLDDNGMTTVAGWSVDGTTHRPALAVVITVGDEVWISRRPTIDRPDIAAMHPGYRRSGFQIFGRGASRAALANLRAFAILADGTAVELGYAKDVRHGGARH